MSLSDEVYSAPEHVTSLFTPDDYLECDDALVVEIYNHLKGLEVKRRETDVSRYYLSAEGYLMHLDAVTNKMAVVVPTEEAQAELIRRFHLDFDRHPHWKQQVY